MAKITKRLGLAGTVLLVAYVGISLTPMKAMIGRQNPSAASLLSPPLFNFSHTYNSGDVLEFTVGMTRADMFEALRRHYSGRAELIANCIVTTAKSLVPITADLDVAAAYGGGERLCVGLEPRRLSIYAEFKGDAVSRIEIVFRRTELP